MMSPNFNDRKLPIYGACVTGCLDEPTQAIIRALQRRYRPAKIDGIIDMQVMELLKRLRGVNGGV